MKINKFKEFIFESDFRKTDLKSFKFDKDYIEIANLWKKGKKEEAAKVFRDKLIKISNSKLGISLILIVSRVVTAFKVLIPLKTPKEEIYIIKKGDCIWDIVKTKLGPKASNEDILAYIKQIFIENGFNWKLADNIITKNSTILKDPDLLFPGGKLIINKFVK